MELPCIFNLSGDQGGSSNQVSVVMSEPKWAGISVPRLKQVPLGEYHPQEAANAGAQWKPTTEYLA